MILGERQAMKIYDLAIHVEETHDGGDYRYVATSPDLPGLHAECAVAPHPPCDPLSLESYSVAGGCGPVD